MNHQQKSVPSVYARELLLLLEELGVSSDQVLAQTEITPTMLQDPAALISDQEQLQIFSNAANLKMVSDLGMRLGQRHHINHYGLYGYAIQTCENFDQALRVACRFMRLTGVAFTLELNIDDDYYRILLKNKSSYTAAHRLFVEELIFSVHTTLNQILQGDFQYHHVSFDFSANNSSDYYSESLACPLYFEKPYTEIVIDRKIANIPLKYWDPQTSAVCAQQCEKILQRLDVGENISDKVREILVKLPCNQRKAEAVAQRMHVSSRHLRRKLSDENTTFRKVLDELRCELAKEYLAQTKLPLDEIAQLLGFSETSNFRRAFVKWMKESPTQYREKYVD